MFWTLYIPLGLLQTILSLHLRHKFLFHGKLYTAKGTEKNIKGPLVHTGNEPTGYI